MLPKKNRISSDFDFRRVRRVGERFDTPYFSFFINKPREDADPRFGFVVSLKVSKSAAKRNRIRRVLTSEVENTLPRIVGGVEAVFFVRAQAARTDEREIRIRVQKVLHKAGVLLQEET